MDIEQTEQAKRPQPLYRQVAMALGCDPEIFFADRAGAVVGAEKVMGEDGLAVPSGYFKPMIVLDGVQAEFHPAATHCRGHLANQLAASFATLRGRLKEIGDGTLEVCFNGVVEVARAELDSLSDRSKVLGCQPSLNFYGTSGKRVDPIKYRKRSAGGHIHLGLNSTQPQLIKLVPILDILVGNTAVLIDRDPQAAERRTLYGQAGEYRLPAHGLEYRTLSNFWLRDYRLMSLMFGLTRLAVLVWSTKPSSEIWDAKLAASVRAGWDGRTTLLEAIDLRDIQQAINTNDLALAKANFAKVRKFIATHVPFVKGGKETGLDASNLEAFDHFIRRIDEKGLGYWFPASPIDSWTTGWKDANSAEAVGWEKFAAGKVTTDMMKCCREEGFQPIPPEPDGVDPVLSTPVAHGATA